MIPNCELIFHTPSMRTDVVVTAWNHITNAKPHVKSHISQLSPGWDGSLTS